MKSFWAMIRREPGLKIASLAVALVLVSWRANVANPLEKRTYQNQAIKPTGLAEDLLLVTPPRQATVVVRGPRRTLDILSRDSRVEPTVDLSTLRQPTWSTVPIEVELPAGVELLEVNPKDLLVEIDVLERQTKPIVVDLASGAPAPGYVAEDVALSLNRAEISGPRRAVSRVARLTAAVDVIGARDTISGEARLLAVDATGLRVTGVDTNPLTVRYTG
ncbi:MAG TPA: hypothetical protein DCZ72_14410, partial [Armatimonadetes bacterium]|nr:hypothetical protein [Armatimonadota bacterium]